jgi:hypothetical protein
LVEFTAKTAYAMDHSAVAMRGLANATRAGIEASEKSARATLAPYVYAKSASVRHWEPLGIILECFNAGQTPATFFAVGAYAEVAKTGDPAADTIPDDLEYVVWTALGGSAAKTAAISPRTDAGFYPMRLDREGTRYLRVVGRIIYGDIFGMAYETRFVFFKRGGTLVPEMSQAVGDTVVFSPMAGWESILSRATPGNETER